MRLFLLPHHQKGEISSQAFAACRTHNPEWPRARTDRHRSVRSATVSSPSSRVAPNASRWYTVTVSARKHTGKSTNGNVVDEREKDRNAGKPLASPADNTFLHHRPEGETFRLLVDVIRVRQEDTMVYEGDTMLGTIYNGEPSFEEGVPQDAAARQARSRPLATVVE